MIARYISVQLIIIIIIIIIVVVVVDEKPPFSTVLTFEMGPRKVARDNGEVTGTVSFFVSLNYYPVIY